ncbi:hypothetical protein NDU88_007659 [Pleurodeles waltl]|uniref:Uncharacterized protein n=1 Tax=Pleurodeles waltl TaxID=8319 RepID=A0AAV7ST54_PLEWA|nr:hypothetical protein NDU88_007659 [Pleurodeles waltl]
MNTTETCNKSSRFRATIRISPCNLLHEWSNCFYCQRPTMLKPSSAARGRQRRRSGGRGGWGRVTHSTSVGIAGRQPEFPPAAADGVPWAAVPHVSVPC